jgi:hypothetical protein
MKEWTVLVVRESQSRIEVVLGCIAVQKAGRMT